MAATRLANNTIFANINAYKTFVQRGKDNVRVFQNSANTLIKDAKAGNIK